MPRKNGTGPAGRGPMTGRGWGPCGGGAGRQSGRRGFGRKQFPQEFPAPNSAGKEEGFLVEQVSLLEEELKAVKSRLEEIKDHQ